jgi:hypothetical protein
MAMPWPALPSPFFIVITILITFKPGIPIAQLIWRIVLCFCLWKVVLGLGSLIARMLRWFWGIPARVVMGFGRVLKLSRPPAPPGARSGGRKFCWRRKTILRPPSAKGGKPPKARKPRALSPARGSPLAGPAAESADRPSQRRGCHKFFSTAFDCLAG